MKQRGFGRLTLKVETKRQESYKDVFQPNIDIDLKKRSETMKVPPIRFKTNNLKK
tara:strand:- start:783 stop:947 length:165 start_codon:yes stop_codon:yes gene_type:complete